MPVLQNSADETLINALRGQTPVRDLPGVRILNVEVAAERPFEVAFQIESGSSRIQAMGEIRTNLTPKTVETIAPWIARLKSLQPESAFVLISEYLKPPVQAYCMENDIDFLDMAGNISINVPGKLFLRRVGRKAARQPAARESSRILGVYSGKSSRVLRVLLQQPGAWTLTKIAAELAAESDRNQFKQAGSFALSLGSISKVLATLEEELLIRRRGSTILVAEPLRLLTRWAERYGEQYRRRLRRSFTASNPFGDRPDTIGQGLNTLAPGGYALTGSAAASLGAPFVDIDLVDVFLAGFGRARAFRELERRPGAGVKLRIIYPYDFGVFLYARIIDGVPVVSDVQTYLDLYARGGRDRKQADYLLEQKILPSWKQK